MFTIIMYWFLAFPVLGLSDLTGSLFHFWGLWALFMIRFAGVPFLVIQSAISPYMPGVSFQVLLIRSNMITFFLKVTIWCITIIFLASVIMHYMHLYVHFICHVWLELSPWKCPLIIHFLFSDYSQRYSSADIGMLHIWFVLCITNLPVFVNLCGISDCDYCH